MKAIFPISILILALPGSLSYAAKLEESDSVREKKMSNYHVRITPRIHTKGFFTYGGQVGTDNPAFDINVTMEYKRWGLLLYKGVDLKDHTTDYNFSLLAVFRTFKLSQKVTFTPYIGTILEQAEHFADTGSDAACILVTSIRLSPRFTAEHMGLFGNLVFEPTHMDWVNRFRVSYSAKHLDIFASIWHNNKVFDESDYFTGGLNIAYSRMKIAKHVFLTTGLAGLITFHTSEEGTDYSKNALQATLAAQWAY
jgi:hypothetical protein